MTYAAIVLETRISCRHVAWSWWNLRKKDVPAFAAMKTVKILLGCCQPRGGWICMALVQLQGGCEDERYGSHVKASSPLGWRDGSQCDGRILDRILWRVEGVKDDISLFPMMIWSAVVLLYGCWWWIFGCFQLQRFDRQATNTNKQALPHLSPCTSFQSLGDGYLLYLVVFGSSIFISGWAAWWNSKLDFRAHLGCISVEDKSPGVLSYLWCLVDWWLQNQSFLWQDPKAFWPRPIGGGLYGSYLWVELWHLCQRCGGRLGWRIGDEWGSNDAGGPGQGWVGCHRSDLFSEKPAGHHSEDLRAQAWRVWSQESKYQINSTHTHTNSGLHVKGTTESYKWKWNDSWHILWT